MTSEEGKCPSCCASAVGVGLVVLLQYSMARAPGRARVQSPWFSLGSRAGAFPSCRAPGTGFPCTSSVSPGEGAV